jgi:hypothetical protein
MRGWAEGGGSASQPEKNAKQGGGEGRTDTRWFQNPRHHNMWCLRHDLGAVTNRNEQLTKPSAGSGTPQHHRPQHPPHRHRQTHRPTPAPSALHYSVQLIKTAHSSCLLEMLSTMMTRLKQRVRFASLADARSTPDLTAVEVASR